MHDRRAPVASLYYAFRGCRGPVEPQSSPDLQSLHVVTTTPNSVTKRRCETLKAGMQSGGVG